ncbi:MAG: hypothetical protein ACK44E_07665 [Anaerolineales bacterium]
MSPLRRRHNLITYAYLLKRAEALPYNQKAKSLASADLPEMSMGLIPPDLNFSVKSAVSMSSADGFLGQAEQGHSFLSQPASN